MGEFQYRIWQWIRKKKQQRERRKAAQKTYERLIATISNPTKEQMDYVWHICHNEPGRD
jgi:predicted nucleic acid-binding protein